MEDNFVKADSTNLPRIDVLMVANFFKSNPDFYASEFKNVKTSLASRQNYGDDAIGYVQLQRNASCCTLKCRICPEHKVRSKPYTVTMVIDEKEGRVLSCECHDCPASLGGCKHAVAFIMWGHRRSEEPSCTSVECYWKKSTLSKVGTSVKFVTAKKLSKKQRILHPDSDMTDNSVLNEFLIEAKKRKLSSCQLVKCQPDFSFSELEQLSLHQIFLSCSEELKKDVTEVLQVISQKLTDKIMRETEKVTREQYKNSFWYELRYGRITASKAYEVSRCKTEEGSLVASVMGAKTLDTPAMKRGRTLESSVRNVAEKKLGKKFRQCGLFLSNKYPVIAASPDGISGDSVIEIKCPTSEQSSKNYLRDGKITNKYGAQVQLQMYTTGLKKCYFCVADSNFENTNEVKIIEVLFDKDYTNTILNACTDFWKKFIYPLLYQSTL